MSYLQFCRALETAIRQWHAVWHPNFGNAAAAIAHERRTRGIIN